MPPRDRAKHQEFLQLWERRQENGLVTGADYARALGIEIRTAQRWVKEREQLQRAAPDQPRQEAPGRTAELTVPAVMTALLPTTPRRLALLKVLYDASRHATKRENPGCLTRAELANRVWDEGLSPDDRPSDDAIWRDLQALCRDGLVEKVSSGSAGRSDDAYRLNPRAFLQLPADLASEAASLARSLRPLVRLSPFPEAAEQALTLLPARPTLGRAQPRLVRVIKGRVAWEQELSLRYVVELETLIRSRQQLEVTYEPGTGTAERWVCDPLGLVYYWVLDAWYLCVRVHSWPPGAASSLPPVERWGRLTLFRLDRINGYRPNGTLFTYPDDFSLADYLAVPWGVELGEPFTVKVRFEDAFDVLARVRRETAHRRERRLTPIPGGLIYQDTIAGPGEFLRWLRAFGSSAEVLAPDWLRQRARASAERLVQLYEAATEGTTEIAATVEQAATAAEDHAAVPPASASQSDLGCTPSLWAGGQIHTALELLAFLHRERELTEGELVRRLRVAPTALLNLMEELCVMGVPVWASDDELLPDDDYDDAADAERPAVRSHDPQRRWTLAADRPWLPPLQLNSLQVLALLDLAQHLPASSRERHRRVLRTLAASQQGDEERETPSRYQVIKGVLNFYADDRTERWVKVLEQAAGESRRVRVSYIPREQEKPVRLVIDPLGVVFDTDRFLWYVAARRQPCNDSQRQDTVLLRVDRVHDCQVCPDHFPYPPDFSLANDLALSWGVDVGSEPVPVVVRFWDEASVIEKVRQQLHWRQRATLVRENRPPDQRPWGTAQSYLYHDVVQGLNAFRRWLRSFGSSAEALFPNELRQAMAQGAVRQWNLYRGEERP